VTVEAGEEVGALVARCGALLQAIPRLSTSAMGKSFVTGSSAYDARRSPAIVAKMETVDAQIEEALRAPISSAGVHRHRLT
jgi:hypothetical protein